MGERCKELSLCGVVWCVCLRAKQMQAERAKTHLVSKMLSDRRDSAMMALRTRAIFSRISASMGCVRNKAVVRRKGERPRPRQSRPCHQPGRSHACATLQAHLLAEIGRGAVLLQRRANPDVAVVACKHGKRWPLVNDPPRAAARRKERRTKKKGKEEGKAKKERTKQKNDPPTPPSARTENHADAARQRVKMVFGASHKHRGHGDKAAGAQLQEERQTEEAGG